VSLFHRAVVNKDNNCLCSSFSHSNISLLHIKSHLKIFLLLINSNSPTSPVTLSLYIDEEYSLGNFSFSDWSQTHMSSHNLTCLSSPNTHLTLESNQLSWLLTSQNLHKSRHYLDFLLSNLLRFISLHVPYLECSASFHTPTSSTPSLYFHLASKATLNLPASLIPSPPVSTMSQALS